jgi:O-antigen/teichoic acid export membrane protein
VVGLFILSHKIILAVAGINYVSGDIALQILSISLVFAVLGCYYSSCVLLPNKKEHICLAASLISAVVNIVLNFIIIPRFSFYGAALTTLLSEVIVFVIFFLYGCRMYRFSVRRETAVSICVGCLAIGVVCYWIPRIIGNFWTSLIVSVGGSILIYFMVLVITKFSWKRDRVQKNSRNKLNGSFN